MLLMSLLLWIFDLKKRYNLRRDDGKYIGRRSFPVAASMFWNTLPDDIQSAPSVSAFRIDF